MQNSDRRHTLFPPPGKKRRSPHTIRNVLIAAAVFLTAALIFSFGINKWQIHFMLNGEKESGELVPWQLIERESLPERLKR